MNRRETNQEAISRRSAIGLLVGGVAGVAAAACSRLPGGGLLADDGPVAALMPPAELDARLADVQSGSIVVLQVGPEALFRQGRVPGARRLGDAGTSAGLAALEKELKTLPPEVEVVAYCGCCPVDHCPNIRPARRLLAARPKARFLDLPTNFRADWMGKGFAVEKG